MQDWKKCYIFAIEIKTYCKMNTATNIKKLAEKFLDIADELNEQVSAYINGSNSPAAERAYHRVLDAEAEFIKAVNSAYGEHWKVCLNYELAESFLY